ncbi:MAG: hypothetical protein JWO58_816 [Chitinophagaceae bacterium]|nr:hypothetical protein [Chitinophagaceae bacterium]
MKKTSLLFLVLCTSVISCSKKTSEPAPDPNSPTTAADTYYPATQGSYWIYQNYQIDSTGEYELPGTDSVVVSKDSVINGKTYAILAGTDKIFSTQWKVLSCVRDSSGYALNTNGYPRFSSVDLRDTLAVLYDIVEPPIDTFLIYKYYMAGPPASIHVPAGDFTVLNGIQEVTDVRTKIKKPYSNCYAKGVGLVLSQSSYQYQMLQGIYFEKRLVRYYIHP